MRITHLLLAVAASTAVAGAQATYNSNLAGTAHDWRTRSSSTGRLGEFCAVCHIPHVEGRPLDRTNEKLLWSRQMSTLTYTLYDSSFSGTINGVSSQPDGSSRLCLSCHDGTVATAAFHTNTNPGTRVITGSILIGSRDGVEHGVLRADHPISITYNWGLATGQDPYLKDPSQQFGGMVTNQTITDILENNKVQCASCHDVHNTEVPTGAEYLLRIKNNDVARPSALCQACHIK